MSFGLVVLITGVLVVAVGPFLGGGKGHGVTFNWYVLGGITVLAGAWLMWH